MTASLATSQELNAMLRALRETPELTVVRDDHAGTVKVLLTEKPSLVVFTAIQKGGAGSPWIVRQIKGLITIA